MTIDRMIDWLHSKGKQPTSWFNDLLIQLIIDCLTDWQTLLLLTRFHSDQLVCFLFNSIYTIQMMRGIVALDSIKAITSDFNLYWQQLDCIIIRLKFDWKCATLNQRPFIRRVGGVSLNQTISIDNPLFMQRQVHQSGTSEWVHIWFR